jgi:uncharacterized protein YciI
LKYALLYTNVDLTRAAELFPAHRARWKDSQDKGTLLMVGPFTPPSDIGAMGIFTTREAAEAFAKDDPFVVHGVVSSWRILEWKEAIFAPV